MSLWQASLHAHMPLPAALVQHAWTLAENSQFEDALVDVKVSGVARWVAIAALFADATITAQTVETHYIALQEDIDAMRRGESIVVAYHFSEGAPATVGGSAAVAAAGARAATAAEAATAMPPLLVAASQAPAAAATTSAAAAV